MDRVERPGRDGHHRQGDHEVAQQGPPHGARQQHPDGHGGQQPSRGKELDSQPSAGRLTAAEEDDVGAEGDEQPIQGMVEDRTRAETDPDRGDQE